MALQQPSLTAPPYLLCDWIEFKALSTPAGVFRLDLLRRLWDVNRQSEDTDPQGLGQREEDTDDQGVQGGDDEAFIDSVVSEFGERKIALGNSYPFEISSGTNVLRVVGPPTAGGYVYLFCLLLTYANAAEVLDGSWLPEVTNPVRDLFQVGSTLAAAGEISGCAISFGWPRPNGNPPFLQRLKEVYGMFGEGEVVRRPRRGVSPSPKDEEIDVIAWRPRPDRSAGTHYLLGQVASGDNWMAKPIAGKPIENFHRNWFTQPPASEAKGYIFIPHAVPPADMGGTRRERMNALTVRYGTIIDRMRLPSLTDVGLVLSMHSTENRLHIERADEMDAIATWVNQQLAALQKAVSS